MQRGEKYYLTQNLCSLKIIIKHDIVRASTIKDV